MTTTATTNYIAHNNGIIYGIGDSHDSAAAAAHDDTGAIDWTTNPAIDWATNPATDALVALVDTCGGAVRWTLVDGVACTEDEAA